MDYKFLSKIEDIQERFVQYLECLIDMIQGLIYLHQKGIIHRDIKPQNMILTEENKVKWIDFGNAKGLNATSRTISGTRCFAAPEITMIYGQKADVYSFGQTAICLWNGVKVVNEGETFNLPIEPSPEVQKLLESCTNEDPMKRPYFEDIRNCLSDYISKNDSLKIQDLHTYSNS